MIGGARRATEAGLPVFDAALALALVDQLDECRTLFERLEPDAFARLLRGTTWTSWLAFQSEVCAALGDQQRAEALHALFEPHSGHLVIVANAIACTGAVDRYLGMLESVLHDWTHAEQHFDTALALEHCGDADLQPGARHDRLLG